MWNDASALGDGDTMQAYIEGGRFGVMGSPGSENWQVVHADDGLPVSGRCGSPVHDEQTARDLAETLNDAE